MRKYTRLAKKDDLSEIMRIIADAKDFLKASGSPQWQNGYPNESVIMDDIEKQILLLEIRLLALRQQLQELNPLIKQSMVVGAMIMILIVQFIGSVLVPTFRVKV